MNSDDMSRLAAENRANWKASIPGTKIGKREQSAHLKLSEIGVGVRVPQSDVKGCGDETIDKLDVRCFVGCNELLSPEEVFTRFGCFNPACMPGSTCPDRPPHKNSGMRTARSGAFLKERSRRNPRYRSIGR